LKLALTFVIAGMVALPVIAQAQSSPIQRGRAIAERLCARCHSVAEAGESPLRIAPPFRVLSQRYPIEQLAEALAEGIVTGHPGMPQFTFTPAEIDALLSFIDNLSPPDVSRGSRRR
jgi:mono/diheme cytochrome c family protein